MKHVATEIERQGLDRDGRARINNDAINSAVMRDIQDDNLINCEPGYTVVSLPVIPDENWEKCYGR